MELEEKNLEDSYTSQLETFPVLTVEATEMMFALLLRWVFDCSYEDKISKSPSPNKTRKLLKSVNVHNETKSVNELKDIYIYIYSDTSLLRGSTLANSRLRGFLYVYGHYLEDFQENSRKIAICEHPKFCLKSTKILIERVFPSLRTTKQAYLSPFRKCITIIIQVLQQLLSW